MSFTSFPSLLSLSEAAATEIVQLEEHSIKERGKFSLVLSGGETPKTLYKLLATKYRDKIDWQHVHLYWGDERYVPHDDPASNYRMAYETLISKIDIPKENTHPIPTDFENPQDAANAYASVVKNAMPFDLILLGLGDDGHIASLFPGPGGGDAGRHAELVIVTHSPKPPATRISLTMRVINESRNVFFLVSGKEKKEAFDRVMKGDLSLPASHVQAKQTTWFVDNLSAT